MEVETSSLMIHVRERSGDGSPVVLVHGWATTGSVYKPAFERWSGDERLLAVDLRGTGWSDKPASGYTLEAFASDVAAVLESLDEPAVLVGHSMGGAIAQLVAVNHPDKVSGLVLISPVPASGVPLGDADKAFFRSLAGRRDGMATVLGSTMAPAGCDRFEELLADSATVTKACFLEAFDAWCGADFADRLGEISVPTTVIGGAAETILSPEVLQAAVVDCIEGATLVLIDGVGHYPQWEAPDAFVAALGEAVRRR